MFSSLYIVTKCRSCPAKQVDDHPPPPPPPPPLLIKPSAPTVLQLHSTNNMFPWFAAGFRSPVWPVTKVSRLLRPTSYPCLHRYTAQPSWKHKQFPFFSLTLPSLNFSLPICPEILFKLSASSLFVLTFPLTNCPFVEPPSSTGCCLPCPASVLSFSTHFILSILKWRQQILPIISHQPTKLHDITSRQTIIFECWLSSTTNLY